jgi:hypothetical protein
MGYERKRGKLGDLNALLRGGAGADFSLIVGDISTLQVRCAMSSRSTRTRNCHAMRRRC